MTADREKAAVDWLLRRGAYSTWHDFTNDSREERATLLEMVQRPTLPAEPDAEILRVMAKATRGIDKYTPDGAAWRVFRALHAHLTAPKTRTVWVVRASWAKPEAKVTQFECASRELAHGAARELIREDIISVTITAEER